MKNEVLYYFDLAAKAAKKDLLNNNTGKAFFLYSIGVRKDQVIVGASNLVSDLPNRIAHAEARTAKMLDRGASVFVVRLRKDFSLAIARPCHSCQKILTTRGVAEAFYTISDNTFGRWQPGKDDKHYSIERKIYLV